MSVTAIKQETLERFIDLFGGLDHVNAIGAFGTGKGEWVKRNMTLDDVSRHLQGVGPGIGISPLNPNNKVSFAAIDLDEPDFDAAREMQEFLPGQTFIEKSRSGNAHVWVFFSEPVDAWVPQGILKEATLAAGKKGVEVFPKNHDFARVKYGSYINLPFHGDSRPVLRPNQTMPAPKYTLQMFLKDAQETLQDPADWRKRADWLLISPPDSREAQAEFGQQPNLHICGEYLIERREENPVMAGHRSVVYFSLAKMLTNWSMCDHDEALMWMNLVNEDSPDRIEEAEIRRILGNAERGQFTSTGCDDPLFLPYAHPDCKIAQGG